MVVDVGLKHADVMIHPVMPFLLLNRVTEFPAARLIAEMLTCSTNVVQGLKMQTVNLSSQHGYRSKSKTNGTTDFGDYGNYLVFTIPFLGTQYRSHNLVKPPLFSHNVFPQPTNSRPPRCLLWPLSTQRNLVQCCCPTPWLPSLGPYSHLPSRGTLALHVAQ